ncbi:hypothetical protein CR513_16565, partial [Mucuna pruriens]
MVNSEGEIAIAKQVSLAFIVGQYKDEVLYDVVPMEAAHIVLGRPWQYDCKVIHEGLPTNPHSSIEGRRVS